MQASRPPWTENGVAELVSITRPASRAMSAPGRYCCKSPKLKSDNFSARRQSKSRSLVDMASISLPKSPVSLSLGDEAPSHVYLKGASTARRNFDQQCKK